MEAGCRRGERDDGAVKQRVQLWIVCGSVALLAAKFAAFFLTNSVAVLTDAMESIVNVAAGFVSLWSLRLASRPKDGDHPFGHGKIELISASLEGLMIIAAGAVIIFEGGRRLFEPSPVGSLDVGIAVVAAAGAANFLMGSVSIRMGRKFDSVALVAGGRHLHSDTYSTVGLVAGLLVLYFTGIAWIDSLLALLFGGLILATGVSILRKTVANLTDEADGEALGKILDVINSARRDDWIDVHNMKVIKYGSWHYIDCDLTLPRFYNIKQGHDSYELLKGALTSGFSEKILFSIHFDPCKPKHCRYCPVAGCPTRSEAFEKPLALTMDCMTHVEKHD